MKGILLPGAHPASMASTAPATTRMPYPLGSSHSYRNLPEATSHPPQQTFNHRGDSPKPSMGVHSLAAPRSLTQACKFTVSRSLA